MPRDVPIAPPYLTNSDMPAMYYNSFTLLAKERTQSIVLALITLFWSVQDSDQKQIFHWILSTFTCSINRLRTVKLGKQNMQIFNSLRPMMCCFNLRLFIYEKCIHHNKHYSTLTIEGCLEMKSCPIKNFKISITLKQEYIYSNANYFNSYKKEL